MIEVRDEKGFLDKKATSDLISQKSKVAKQQPTVNRVHTVRTNYLDDYCYLINLSPNECILGEATQQDLDTKTLEAIRDFLIKRLILKNIVEDDSTDDDEED